MDDMIGDMKKSRVELENPFSPRAEDDVSRLSKNFKLDLNHSTEKWVT
jgi:hypothetical protein